LIIGVGFSWNSDQKRAAHAIAMKWWWKKLSEQIKLILINHHFISGSVF
jgi:hypothetical protein